MTTPCEGTAAVYLDSTDAESVWAQRSRTRAFLVLRPTRPQSAVMVDGTDALLKSSTARDPSASGLTQTCSSLGEACTMVP